MGIGHGALGMGQAGSVGGVRGWGSVNSLSPISPHSPHSLIPTPHSPLPTPQILKTLLANYALDKLKIEIAGNSHPAFASLILWEGLRPNLGRIFSQAGSLCED
ncbi:MAG: hypothetical protein RMY29_000365 [Nostoc sp. CreGUA01]